MGQRVQMRTTLAWFPADGDSNLTEVARRFGQSDTITRARIATILDTELVRDLAQVSDPATRRALHTLAHVAALLNEAGSTAREALGGDRPAVATRIIDLSDEGLKVSLPDHFESGQKLGLSFQIDQTAILSIAEIRWRQPHTEAGEDEQGEANQRWLYGIRFNDMEPSHQRTLRRFTLLQSRG